MRVILEHKGDKNIDGWQACEYRTEEIDELEMFDEPVDRPLSVAHDVQRVYRDKFNNVVLEFIESERQAVPNVTIIDVKP